MSNSLKKARALTSLALVNALGGRLLLVLFLLILISWTGDALLNLISAGLDLLLTPAEGKEPNFIQSILSSDFIVLAFALVIFTAIWKLSKDKKFTDELVPKPGKNSNDKKTLVIPLSTYSQRRKVIATAQGEKESSQNGYTKEKLDKNMSLLPAGLNARQLRYTDFQSNWLPALKTIESLSNLEEIIVITTSGKWGSHQDYELFKKLVRQHLGKEIDIKCYNEFLNLKDKEKEGLEEGTNINNIVSITDLSASIIEKLLGNDRKPEEIIVDVTGGLASMSAALASVSVLNDVEIHYINTRTFELQTLDVQVQVK